MDDKLIYLILGMTLVTYLPRALPLILLTKIDLPEWALKWLAYIPVAVLAALLAPGIFQPSGVWDFSFSNIYLLAAFPTLFVAFIFKSMIMAVVTGMLIFLLLQFL